MVLARSAWPSCSPTDKQTSPKETLEHGARWQAVDSSVFSQMHSCPSQPCRLNHGMEEKGIVDRGCLLPEPLLLRDHRLGSGLCSALGGPHWEGPSSGLGGPQQWTGRAPVVVWEGPSSGLGEPQQWTGRAPAVDLEGPSSGLGGPQQ
ncbi:unnamed protein product [Boreogadus saida]